MKKILLLFSIIVVFSGVLMAQESESTLGSKVYLGAKGAVGIVKFNSMISNEIEFGDITFTNLSYGIAGGYNLTPNIGFQVEATYSQYGADNIIETYIYSPGSPALQPYGEFSVVDHVNLDLFNIDIPVLVKFSFSKFGFSPYIYAGANWGINVLGTTTIVRKISESVEIFRDYKDDISSRIRYNEFAPVGGLGAKMNMGSFSFLLDARYKHGFKNLSNVDNGLGFTNKALWISLGMVYNL